MRNPADNDYPVNDLIKERWSPRAFSDKPVKPEDLRSLFEAARWAPSCYNDQPWYFMLGTREHSPEVHRDILECLVDANQEWARFAPVLGLSVARTQFEFNNKPNRHALHDVGLAVENLVLEALDRGLYVHQMAGFVEARARTKFNIPEHYEPVAGIAIGYPGDPDRLPDEKQEQEGADRERRPLKETVFGSEWGETSTVLE